MVTLELFQVFPVLDFYVGVSVEGMILLGCTDEVCMHLCIESKYACNIHVRHTNFHLYNIYTIPHHHTYTLSCCSNSLLSASYPAAALFVCMRCCVR